MTYNVSNGMLNPIILAQGVSVF